MINPDNGVPGIGRMAGITTGGAGDMGRGFAGGGRSVVTGITVSYYSRMVNLDDRLPPAGCMAGAAAIVAGDVCRRFSGGGGAVMAT